MSTTTTMPSSPATSTPNDSSMVLGPHKHCPAQHMGKEDDSVASKRVKQMLNTSVKDVSEPVTPPCPKLQTTLCAPEANDGSDDNIVIDVDKSEEDDNDNDEAPKEDDDSELGE